ncbi:MAG TPA: homoserine dehydrogenase, partial [Blastocatellia bacterium]|nr:homoserine dehydrogenase [Blastocatellia bacterium]
RRALSRGISVVTANKGPLAFAYHEMRALAIQRGASFRFEGTVMDGTPVFNLAEYCLPASGVTGFYGVLNSTTNFILTGLETGRPFDESLLEARKLGIVEANAEHDIDGWDATVKSVALANVLMGADARPRDVERCGIRNLGPAEGQGAVDEGLAIRLVARAEMRSGKLMIRVGPERLPRQSLLGSTTGTSNALVLQTDLMGELALVEFEPGIEQTGYALLSDLIRVHEDMLRGRRRRPPKR